MNLETLTQSKTESIAPRQKLSRKQKTKAWGQQNVDNIIKLAGSTSASKYLSTDKVNYDLYNNIINKEDFKYVTDGLGLNEEQPAKLENYNIITPKLKLLEGEEIKRAFNFRVAAINSEAVSQIQEKKKKLLLQHLESELLAELEKQGIQVQNPETGETMTPEQIEKYMSYSESDIRESTANKLAKYLIKEQNLEYKFNKVFKDALIVAKEVMFVGIEGANAVCNAVNPPDFSCDMSPELDFIEDGQWACETKYCTPSDIIDTYYKDLTEDEVNRIDQRQVGQNNLGLDPSDGKIPITKAIPNLEKQTDTSNYITVQRVEWKSLRKIGFLKYYDEDFVEQETIVDEIYEVQEDKGESIEWVWINEVWEGTKIGNDIYTRIRPKKVQFRSIDNPSRCKLGYVGAIHNNRNSRPTSIIDYVKSHQYLYNTIMYRMELEIAKASGKKVIIDLAQIPKSQGITLDKWLYYFQTVGIGFINSFEEGGGKFAGMTSSFNQFTNIDMALSQSVQQYVIILNKIESMAGELMGVSPQRLGAISTTETVGGVERSVVQSSHITEPLFYLHNEVKKNVLTQLIECAKVAYPEGKRINYILDDMSRVFIEMDEGFGDVDYGVFVTNSAKENKSLEDLKNIAQQAVASGIITLRELVTIFDSESVADIKNVVKQAEQRADESKQQEYQSQQQLQQQALEAQKTMQTELQDRLDNREQIKGQINKEITYIKTFGGVNASPEDDADGNGVPDVIEYQKLSQQAKEHEDDKVIKNRELDIKEKDIAAKVQIAKSRPKPSK
jgi:hypothetical protein